MTSLDFGPARDSSLVTSGTGRTRPIRDESEYRPPAPIPPERRLGLARLLLTLARNPLECWPAECFRESIVRVRIPLCPAFLVHDPAAIRRVLIDNAGNYVKDPIQKRILSAGLDNGLLSVEGERWQAQRRTLAPLFARKTVNTFAGAMLSAADELTKRWRRACSEEPIDVSAEMTLLTLNVLALTIFSEGIGGDLTDFRRAMKSYFETIGHIGAFDLFGVPAAVPRLGLQRRLKQTAAYFEHVIDEMIEKRRRRSDTADTGDLLGLLLRAVDPSTGRPMSIAEVRSNVLTFLSAGHETTANTLTWSLFLLSQSAYWRTRVREEADRELAGPRDGLLERLVTAKAVVEEALRLYPPIAALSRMSIQSDDLGTCSVTPRSLIVVAPYVLHRHQRLWDRPAVFDPRRFLAKSREAIGRFSYLPFGTGPRTCIGSAFALQEATLVLATLVQRFDFELPPGVEVWPLQRVTLRPANGLPMRVSPRMRR